MHENTSGRVTFLVNLMFSKLDKFDGPISEGAFIRGSGVGAYIRDVNWVIYIWGRIFEGGAYIWGPY